MSVLGVNNSPLDTSALITCSTISLSFEAKKLLTSEEDSTLEMCFHATHFHALYFLQSISQISQNC